jgi:3'(2'), 5'-bisphosphate nucleotidase
VTKETWWAERGHGAHVADGKKLWHPKERSGGFIAAGSRSMPSDRMKIFCEFFDVGEVRRYGSALKFCHLAEGKIDLYPRFGPTNEWDTAAGQLIAEEAGCKVIDISTQLPLAYGKSRFINSGGFVASRADLEFVGRLEELRSKLPK